MVWLQGTLMKVWLQDTLMKVWLQDEGLVFSLRYLGWLQGALMNKLRRARDEGELVRTWFHDSIVQWVAIQ